VRGLRGAAARRRQTCFPTGDVARDCVDPERLVGLDTSQLPSDDLLDLRVYSSS